MLSQASSSFDRCFRSILSIHNETGMFSSARRYCFPNPDSVLTMTVNIWSHLLGALFYSSIPLQYHSILRSRYSHANTIDILALAIYFLGVTTCFTLSTLYVVPSRHAYHANTIAAFTPAQTTAKTSACSAALLTISVLSSEHGPLWSRATISDSTANHICKSSTVSRYWTTYQPVTHTQILKSNEP